MIDPEAFFASEAKSLEQIAEKWLLFGLSSNPIDKEYMVGAVNDYYISVLGKDRAVPVVFVDGPFEACATAALLSVELYGVGDQSIVYNTFKSFSVPSSSWLVHGGLLDDDEFQFEIALDRHFWRTLGTLDSLYDLVLIRAYEDNFHFCSFAASDCLDRIDVMVDAVKAKLPEDLELTLDFKSLMGGFRRWFESIFWNYGTFRYPLSQFAGLFLAKMEVISYLTDLETSRGVDSPWKKIIANYDDCSIRTLTKILANASSCGVAIPTKKFCVVMSRPTKIALNDDRVVHCSNGPAITYGDGTSLWMLNGVQVPSWLVLTKDEDLPAKRMFEISQADVRREFVRKVGIERLCDELKAKTIEKGVDHNGNPCELLDLELDDTGYRPFLKMRNASIPSIYHIEGVHPRCLTIRDAFEFRNGTYDVPEQLT